MPTATRRRRPAAPCPPEVSGACPASGELALMATGMQAMFDEQRKQTSILTETRLLGEQRHSLMMEIKGRLDLTAETMDERDAALKRRVDDHADEIRAMKDKIAEREGLFNHARRIGMTFVTGVGLVVLGTILYAGAWTVKKLFGIDISPFLRG